MYRKKPNYRLYRYVKRVLKTGISKEKIKNKLLEVGWDKETVDKVLRKKDVDKKTKMIILNLILRKIKRFVQQDTG